jgi:cytidylate kinase
MSAQSSLEPAAAFIRCLLKPNSHPNASHTAGRYRAVTISRQAGCGGRVVGAKLAEYLQAQSPKSPYQWTVFDRNLVERVLADHKLPGHLAKFMPEDRVPEIEGTIEELCGLHPPSWILVRQTAETILHLAELGNVILVGRGANIITSKLDHIFHVRLVGSLEKRIEHVQQYDHLERKAALSFIKREDDGRRRYLRKYFKKDIDDALLYHLVINTDLVPYQEAARIIADAILKGRPAHFSRIPTGASLLAEIGGQVFSQEEESGSGLFPKPETMAPLLEMER